MASTNKTTNYELSQFIETDRPAWLTDYNGDMRTIDSTMKAISDVASGASGSISELADRMSTAEGNITTNTNDIATLDARADSLEAQAQSTAGAIANIQTEQITQNAGIEAATELGYNLARPYDSASTYAVGTYVLFQNTLYKCITAVATGEAFDPTKWLAIKATDEIAAGGYTLPIASASTLGGVKVGNGLSIDPVSGILSASGNAEIIELNNENTSFSISATVYTLIKNFYLGDRSYRTPITLKNATITINPVYNIKSFLAKIGRLRLLHLELRLSFDEVTVAAKVLFQSTTIFKISTPESLDFPTGLYAPSQNSVPETNFQDQNSIRTEKDGSRRLVLRGNHFNAKSESEQQSNVYYTGNLIYIV